MRTNDVDNDDVIYTVVKLIAHLTDTHTYFKRLINIHKSVD